MTQWDAAVAELGTARHLINVLWTSTILVADRCGVTHGRSVTHLPPADFPRHARSR